MVKLNTQHIKEAVALTSLVLVIIVIYFIWCGYMSLLGIEYLFKFNIPKIEDIYNYIIITFSVLIFCHIYFVIQLLKTNQLEKELAIQKISNEAAQNTIKILRSQRHDFLNHLQVVMGYIQLGKSQSAINYLKNVNIELKSVRAVSGIEMPEVAVLLFLKREEALRNGITMEYSINTDLSDIKINEVDMVRILSNLIDNAIYELRNQPAGEQKKYIRISFDKVGDTFYVEVNNKPGTLKEDYKIFEYGFTTKGDYGSGIGLYNVKGLVEEKYKGKIKLISHKKEGTSFKILL